MAVTQNTYTGNGSTVLYSFTFPYLATTDVKVKLNGSDTTAYSLANATTVQMNSAPANGDKIIIYRNTDNDNKKATFYPGSAIKAEDLNDNYDQILYTVQEVDNNAMSTLGDTAMQGDFLMGSGFGLQFEGATTDDFETRLIATDPTQDNVINLPNASGDLVTTGSLKTGGIDTNDNVKIRFGTGNDLEIYHNGSNSYIDNTTGNLYFRGSDGQMLFRPNNNEDALVLKPNGAVELYFNNQKQIETTTLGAAITGSLGIGITTPTFGSGNGLHVRGATGGQTRIHITTNYSGDTASDGFDIAALGAESGSSGGMINFIQHEAKSVKFQYGSENMIKMVPDGTVELYFDGSKKLETDSSGITVSGDLTFSNSSNDINLKGGKIYGNNNAADDLTIQSTSGNSNHSKIVIGDNFGSDNGGISFYGAGSSSSDLKLRIRGNTDTVEITDNHKFVCGDGSDLQIYHDGSHSYIDEVSNGDLILKTNIFRVRGTNNEAIITGSQDGNVALYFNNDKKLETTANGVSVEGTAPRVALTDVNGNDYAIIVDGNDFNIQDTTAGENRLNINSSGIVSCNDGLFVPDAKSIFLGNSNDLQLKHDGSHSYIKNTTGHLKIGDANVRIMNAACDEDMIHAKQNEAVELYYGGAIKAQTYANGWSTDHLTLTGNAYLADNKKVFLGDGDDLQIYHDGTHSYLDNATGNLHIRGNGADDVKIQAKNGEQSIICHHDGAVELYFDNSKKLETTSNGAKLHGHLKLDDNDQLRLGDATLGDFVLVHNATDSIINNSTGNLFYRSATHKLQALNGHDMLVGNTGGSVELYHNNSKKLETTSYGVAFVDEAKFDNNTNANRDVVWDPASDQMRWTDNTKATFGTTSDLVVYHDGSDSIIHQDGTGDLRIRSDNSLEFNTAGTQNAIWCDANAAVKLYYDNDLKFKTTSSGVNVTGSLEATSFIKVPDAVSMILGNGNDVTLQHDGTNFLVTSAKGYTLINSTNGDNVIRSSNDVYLQPAGGDFGVKCVANGSTEIYWDGNKKLETTSSGATITGKLLFDSSTEQTIKLADNRHIHFGDDVDLKLFHDGGNAHFECLTGTFKIKGNDIHLQNASGNQDYITAAFNGAVELYHSGSEKLKTTSGGVTVTGSVTTQDINMSNLNASSGNEVDGTKGNWTMQEGESDLFLINRISGKKYKFNLTEIN